MNRKKGKTALKTVLKSEKNIDIFEKIIFGISEDVEQYNYVLYNTISMIKDRKYTLKQTLKLIKDEKLFWDSPSFNSFKLKQQEQDEFLIQPFEVEEGVLECNKCGSKKTFSYTKQTRSGDEATTVFRYMC